MHHKDNAAAAAQHDTLVLERLPSGEHAWLRPEHYSTYKIPANLSDMVAELLAARSEHPCRFGICEAIASRIVVSATQVPIGWRCELLCAYHAGRRATLDQVLVDQPISAQVDEPAPVPASADDEQHAAGWRDGWQHFTFSCPTTYTLFAPNIDDALAWFTDEADVDIDCGPMEFGEPTLLAIETSEGEPIANFPQPQPDDDDRVSLTALGVRTLAEIAAFDAWTPVAEAALEGAS